MAEEPESWRKVVGFEGFYEVSDLGRIRSLARMTPAGARGGRILKPMKSGRGYLAVTLCLEGLKGRDYVHRIVLTAFRGPCPEGMEARHFPDFHKTNNRLANLSWATSSVNAQDRDQHGEKHPSAKFCRVDVERIFDLKRSGCSQQAIGDWLGMAQTNVGLILRGKRWAHLRNG